MYDDDHRAWCEGNDEVAVAEENGNNDEKHEKTSAPNQIKHLVNAWAWVNVCECVWVCVCMLLFFFCALAIFLRRFCSDFGIFFLLLIHFICQWMWCEKTAFSLASHRKQYHRNMCIALRTHYSVANVRTIERFDGAFLAFIGPTTAFVCVCVYVCALWICQWTHYQDKRY